MSEAWKDTLKDIQDQLKLMVREKLPIFSCVYIELSKTCLEEKEINFEKNDIWKDLDMKFTPCREFHVGTPLVRKFNSPNPFRHPQSSRFFVRGKETFVLLQWYRKPSEAAPFSNRPSNRILLPIRPITKLDDCFQYLIDAVNAIPLPLFQSILGKETVKSHNPLDDWMQLLFAIAWQGKSEIPIRTRDLVYWPHIDEEQEYEFQDWIPFDDAQKIIFGSRGEKIKDKTATNGLGRYFLKHLPNLFSVVDDVFQSSIYLFSVLLRRDFEMQKGGIDRYDREMSHKIIKYAAQYVSELPHAKQADIVKYVQMKYPEFRVDHFHTWGPDNVYAKKLRNDVDNARVKKFAVLGGKETKPKRQPPMSKVEIKKNMRVFCKSKDISIENLEEIIETEKMKTRPLSSVEKELLTQYFDYLAKPPKRKSATKRKKDGE